MTAQTLPASHATSGHPHPAAAFRTIKLLLAHLLHIYTKLGVRDRASAVATAYKRGLLG